MWFVVFTTLSSIPVAPSFQHPCVFSKTYGDVFSCVCALSSRDWDTDIDTLVSMSSEFRLQKIHYLLNPMYKVKDFLTTEFLDWFMDIFPQTTTMILNLSDEELKAEAAKVNDIVDILCTLYRLTSRLDSPEVIDKFRLDLALKGLRSPYLERRLTGLGDINEFVEVSLFLFLSAPRCIFCLCRFSTFV